jgi:hypothetical protein
MRAMQGRGSVVDGSSVQKSRRVQLGIAAIAKSNSANLGQHLRYGALIPKEDHDDGRAKFG